MGLCCENNAKNYGQFDVGNVDHGTRKRGFSFGGNPDHRLDPGIFKSIF